MKIDFTTKFGSRSNPSCFPEYIASATDGIVTTDYVHGYLWGGSPGNMRRIQADGVFSSIGGDGTVWAALDARKGTVAIGQTASTVENLIILPGARGGTAVTASGRHIWIASSDVLMRLDQCGNVERTIRIDGIVNIATEPGSGSIAVTCPEHHLVLQLDPDLNVTSVIRLVRSRPLRFPRGCAYINGVLWIADTENRRIVRADGAEWFDLSELQGFPVGITAFAGRLCTCIPFMSRVILLPPSRSKKPIPCFYPCAIAKFNNDWWVTHPSSGNVQSIKRKQSIHDLADPVALVAWKDYLAVTERDGSCVTLWKENAGRCVVSMPSNSQPRAICVDNCDQLWVATQTPSALWRCTSIRAEYICPLSVAGLPRALAFYGNQLVLATTTDSHIRSIDVRTGITAAIAEFSEPPVALATHGDCLLVALDRSGDLIQFRNGCQRILSTGLITPRGIAADCETILVAESLANRIVEARWCSTC